MTALTNAERSRRHRTRRSAKLADERGAMSDEMERLRAALVLCAGQLAAIRQANDAADPKSILAEDQDGCADWTFHAADLGEQAALAALAPTPKENPDE